MINRRWLFVLILVTLMSALSAHFISAQSSTLSISYPVKFQVFQRTGTTGAIPVRGNVLISGTFVVQGQFTGDGWGTVATVVCAAPPCAFTGTLANQQQGQGNLKIRLQGYGGVNVVTVQKIGIGDVFGIGGQSNAQGRGDHNQFWSHPSLVATMFGNNYQYARLLDWTDSPIGQVDTVSQDTNIPTSGSIYPLIATQHMAATGVPVMFIPGARSSTSIIAWLPGANHFDRNTLYGSLAYRIREAGGAYIVLWWQGEADAVGGMSQSQYASYLAIVSNAFYADTGARLMPTMLQNSTGIADNLEAPINAAIQQSWGANHIVIGPNLTDLVSDDPYHLRTDAHLLTAATRFQNALALVAA